MKMDTVVMMISYDRDSDDINNTNSSNNSCSDIKIIKEKYKQLFYIRFLQISHSIFIAYCSKNVYDILAIAVVDWQSF